MSDAIAHSGLEGIMRFFLIFLAVILTACSGARTVNYTQHINADHRIEDQHGVLIRINSDRLEFHGYPDFDRKNEAGAMLYPGGTPELFFVAVLTHATIQSSANDSRIQAIQNEADQILVPYLNTINGISAQKEMAGVVQELDQRWSHVSVVMSGVPQGDKVWLLTLEPVFYLLPDQRSILLRNVVKLSMLDSPDHVVYQNLVEVLSDVVHADSPETFWKHNQGDALTSTVRELISYSIDLAAMDIRNEFADEVAQQKTYSFMQGGTKTYQRGNLLMSACKRSTIRTLRGWIKSFPDQSNQMDCESLEPTTAPDSAV